MLVLDRIEGDMAVIEDGENRVIVEKWFLPESAREGDVLVQLGETYLVDEEESACRRKQAMELTQKIMGKKL